MHLTQSPRAQLIVRTETVALISGQVSNWGSCSVVAVSGSVGATADFVEGCEGGFVGVGEGVEVEGGGGDVGVAEAFFDDLEVGAAGE